MDVCTKSYGDRKVLYSSSRTYFFADLAYSQGEHGQHSRTEISACTRGEHNPLPLMTKGENNLEDLGVTIKSKGGDCWHYGTGLELWRRCCP